MKVLVKTISEVEYLEQEAVATTKSEYHHGEIVNMAGAREEHNLIVANAIVELGICLKGKHCKIYPSDMPLKLAQCNKYVYPDVMVVCDKADLEQLSKKGLKALLNPTVIIEVLSENTALYDKVEKKRCYQMLASLQQYVMIDSTQVALTHYIRTSGGQWMVETLQSLEESVQIGDCFIKLADLYAQISFEDEPEN
jgi:Uma2 family endonuclease